MLMIAGRVFLLLARTLSNRQKFDKSGTSGAISFHLWETVKIDTFVKSRIQRIQAGFSVKNKKIAKVPGLKYRKAIGEATNSTGGQTNG